MGEKSAFKRYLMGLGADRPASDILLAKTSRAKRRPKKLICPQHSHVADGYEFGMLTKGRARIVTPFQVFDLVPGLVMVIEPGVEHGRSESNPADPYQMFWCSVRRTRAQLAVSTFDPPASYRLGPSLELYGQTDLELIAAAIAGELRERKCGWQRMAGALLTYLAGLVGRRLHRESFIQVDRGGSPASHPGPCVLQDPPPRTSSHGVCSPAVEREPRARAVLEATLEFCRANHRCEVRLADVAAAVGYSPSHLSHLISSELGYGLSDHLRTLRMSTAKELLEDRTIAIGDVASSLGYGDPSHFSHAFRRHTGISPRSYRRRLQGVQLARGPSIK